MIAMAATVVSQRHGDLANVLSEWTGVTFLQLTFVCGPDATFSDRTRGPTNVNWKQHFNQYKQTVLRLPPDLSASLFSWYDLRVFGHIPASGASTTTAHVQGHGDVDELIERFQRQAIVAVTLSSFLNSIISSITTRLPRFFISIPHPPLALAHLFPIYDLTALLSTIQGLVSLYVPISDPRTAITVRLHRYLVRYHLSTYTY